MKVDKVQNAKLWVGKNDRFNGWRDFKGCMHDEIAACDDLGTIGRPAFPNFFTHDDCI